MQEAVNFLKKSRVFFLATADGDQPHVRPFGAVCEYHGKIYICTSNQKDCFRQMAANPKVEICAMDGDDRWIRICGKVSVDPGLESRKHFLEECPLPMYQADDGKFEVLYFVSGTVSICSFTQPTVSFQL